MFVRPLIVSGWEDFNHPNDVVESCSWKVTEPELYQSVLTFSFAPHRRYVQVRVVLVVEEVVVLVAFQPILLTVDLDDFGLILEEPLPQLLCRVIPLGMPLKLVECEFWVPHHVLRL